MHDDDLPARLLDAQVRWALSELEDPRLPEVIAEDVATFLDVAAEITLAEVLDVGALQAAVRRVALLIAGTPLAHEIGMDLALGADRWIRELQVPLGEAVDREAVDALVARAVQVTGVAGAGGGALAQSPTGTKLVVRIVGAIVTDVLSQNRAIAEKVPGVSSLLSFGTGAVSKVGRLGRAAVGELPLERLIGDAVGSGAQATVRRTRAIIREVVTPEAVHQVAMEMWDSVAEQPIADLVAVIDPEDVADLLERGAAVVASAREGQPAAELIDQLVAEFLATHGDVPITDLLSGLGLDAATLTEHATRLALPAVRHLRDQGSLERVIRDRLSPFWDSAEVAALLDPASP